MAWGWLPTSRHHFGDGCLLAAIISTSSQQKVKGPKIYTYLTLAIPTDSGASHHALLPARPASYHPFQLSVHNLILILSFAAQKNGSTSHGCPMIDTLMSSLLSRGSKAQCALFLPLAPGDGSLSPVLFLVCECLPPATLTPYSMPFVC